MRALVKDAVIGYPAGFIAGRAMDQATTLLMKRQSKDSVERERQLNPEGASISMVKTVADWFGIQLGQQAATTAGKWAHQNLGLTGGLIIAILVRRGVAPISAGLLTSGAMWLLVDEAMNATLGFTPPAPHYPFATHARGLVGHAVFGITAGAIAGLANRLLIRPERPGY